MHYRLTNFILTACHYKLIDSPNKVSNKNKIAIELIFRIAHFTTCNGDEYLLKYTFILYFTSDKLAYSFVIFVTVFLVALVGVFVIHFVFA